MGKIRKGLPALLLIFFAALLYISHRTQGQEPAAGKAAEPIPQFKNTQPGVDYVGSKKCAECHTDVYESFRKTGMGRSMALPGERREIKALAAPVRIKRPNSNRYYEVYKRGNDVYQSEYELDAQGHQVFRDEQKVAYIIGSGSNGTTPMVQRGDYMFEAPLSYYSKARVWGLSPGYDKSDYGFSRSIGADCITCHAGRPQPVEASDGKFNSPPFEELPLGCENCHGPGSIHVKERLEGAPLEGPVDHSIVNPDHLPPWLANNICMRCHQGLDAAVLMPGKTYSDYRPGTPLTDTIAIFAVPFNRESPPQDPILQHFALMSISQCYLKSGGKLACISCHDPHVEPTVAEAPAFFRSRCLKCHTDQSCKLSLAARRAKSPPDNCIGCHMPKQSLQGVSHSSLTDHRIPARPGEPLPDAAFNLTAPALPDLVHLNAIPAHAAEQGENLPAAVPPLALLRAYGELMPAHEQYRPRFEAVLDELAQSGSQNSQVLSNQARNLMTEGSPESESKAEELFKRAIAAGSTSDQDVELLATLQAKSGRISEATTTVLRGIDANPFSVLLRRDLAFLYLSAQDTNGAIATMKKTLEIFPEDNFTRSLLQKTLAKSQ